jgi:oxygen-independent coproporphyrinogen-3 oxidase
VTGHSPLPYSLYIHVPFCRRRCSYCDFNTYTGLENLITDYVTALCREIDRLGSAARARLPARLAVHSVFLGGGTPSLLPLVELERIFNAVREAFDLFPAAEISLEANPGTLDQASLQGLRELGINRLSLGMQSAHLAELELLGRIHTYPDVIQAVDWARRAGFDNLNLDLIYGLPGQPLERWEASLRHALALGVKHLSLYALTLEEGTPLLGRVQSGQLPAPDPDMAADMYDLATEVLEQAGFYQYEISNWARNSGNLDCEVQNPSYACRHNLQYWRNRPYLGVGAGAHGYIRMPGDRQYGRESGNLDVRDSEAVPNIQISESSPFLAATKNSPINLRIANVLMPAAYIQRMADAAGKAIAFPQTPATAETTPIDLQTEIGETMMMGLRLTREGVSGAAFRQRFGCELKDTFAPQIERLIGLGLLEWAGAQGDVLRLTRRGRLLGNQVFVEFI